MWKDHWGLADDPFRGASVPYVRTAGHDEAVARLVDSIETVQRLALLRAGAGAGKSTVLSRALVETRRANRRFARAAGAVDGPGMLTGLAGGLGVPVRSPGGRPEAWRALTEGVRLCRVQNIHAVLVVDDCQFLTDPTDRRDLERLAHLDPNPATRLTVVQSFRDDGGGDALSPFPAWQLEILLPDLTRSETIRFVEEKLAALGRTEPAFTPRALRRLHDLSGGVPRGIDRLGSLSLMGAALRGLELVTPDVVDGVARECRLPAPLYSF